MAAEKRLLFIQKNISLFVNILAVLSVLCIIAAAISFVLYGRARMKEQEEQEKFYLKLHYSCLGILFAIGIVFMFFMVETAT